MVTVFVNDWMYGVYTAGVASGGFGLLEDGRVRPMIDDGDGGGIIHTSIEFTVVPPIF
eukprot:SAG11_NODE_2244_length_3640_cov_2.296160_4_plen_58_part_00